MNKKVKMTFEEEFVETPWNVSRAQDGFYYQFKCPLCGNNRMDVQTEDDGYSGLEHLFFCEPYRGEDGKLVGCGCIIILTGNFSEYDAMEEFWKRTNKERHKYDG